MNNTTQSIQKAILFWLSGIRLADIQSLPEGRELIDRSAMVETPHVTNYRIDKISITRF